jgi:hypothetical protein
VVPRRGTKWLRATSPNQTPGKAVVLAQVARIDTVNTPYWIVLHELLLERKLYGAGLYTLRYCTPLADRSDACSNVATFRL